MKNRTENLIMICGLIAMICIGYVFGMNSICKNAYCDDFDYEADEMYEEYAELMAEDEEFRNSFSNSNSKTEISGEIPSENSENSEDLTKEEESDNVIEEDEIADEDVDTEGRTHREIIEETLLQEVNMCKCIDAYEEGNWFAYYVYADGDVYVITFKNNKIDICCQLN